MSKVDASFVKKYEDSTSTDLDQLYSIYYKYDTYKEWIDGNRDPRHRNRWNACSHYKRTVLPSRGGLEATLTGGVNDQGHSSNGNSYVKLTFEPGTVGSHSGSNGLGQSILDAYGVPPLVSGEIISDPPELAALTAAAFAKMLPAVKEEMSLINSVYELKDFKTLPKQLNDIRFKISDLYRKFNDLSARVRASILSGKTFKQSIGSSGDGYLFWSFALGPLISDITALRRTLIASNKEINRLISNAGTTRKQHFQFDTRRNDEVDVSYTSDPYTIVLRSSLAQYISGNVHQCKQNVRVTYEPSKFHAMIVYNYNYTQFQLANAELLALLDKLGVNFNPAIVWNAIPWTFVVDWVFRIGKFLDRYRMQNMEPVVNIQQYLWSYKKSRRVVLSNSTSPSLPVSSHEIPQWIVDETSYKRQTSIPSSSSIQSSGVNFKEFTLAAALVIPKAWKRR